MFFRNLRSKLVCKPGTQQRNPSASTKAGTPQLYLALYARLKYPDSYHFALHITSPGDDPEAATHTMKYHCKNTIVATLGTVSIPWVYEAVKINPDVDPRILVRILLGDVGRVDLVETLLAQVQVVQNDEDFNCITWVNAALLQLDQSGLLERGDISDWEAMQSSALDYVNGKKKQGRFGSDWKGDISRVATFDMTLGTEIWP